MHFTQDLSNIPVGVPLTATATSGTTVDSSEFSPCATTTAPPPPGIVQIEPVADAFVAKGDPDANFGDKTYADVYGGGNTSCVLANGRSYTLMRFDLSAISTGVTITDARLETTTRAGWAQDGDPAHWAIFIPSDSWQENQVTWKNRLNDGLTTEGGTAYSSDNDNGSDIRQSSLSFGGPDVWRNGCNVDPDPVGNQAKVFPSTTDGFPRTVAQARAGLISQIATQRAGDGELSLELWTPNCPVCTVGQNLSYWARYYTREAPEAGRPRLVITYNMAPPVVTNLTINGPAIANAGAAVVPLAGIPPAAPAAPRQGAP